MPPWMPIHDSDSNIAKLQIGADDFSRKFSQRSKNLMWLLGAGASAAAGIPTAWDMIWEFKQLLYISQRKVSRNTVADLSNPATRRQLQTFIDSSDSMPCSEAEDEYAALFEKVYPAEADRRTYIDSKLNGARPSNGHIALATLMKADRTRLVWTTNFDPLIADACAKVYGSTGPLSSVDLDAPDIATQLIGDGRWPIEIKMHGDFRSRRLKNTVDELRHQDSKIRQVFIDSCSKFGLVVAGYSGRDESVMNSIEEAIKSGAAFPAGLFWLHRGSEEFFPQVKHLMEEATSRGIEASFVQITSFDEVLNDLIRLIEEIDTSVLNDFAMERRIWSAAPPPEGNKRWPVIRLNAIPIISVPSVCRRVVCDIGGYAEVRSAIERENTDIVFARTNAGLLAFGSDADVRKTLIANKVEEEDLYTIEPHRLQFDSGERGLLRAALIRAITRNVGLLSYHKRSRVLLAPKNPDGPVWMPLKNMVGSISGHTKNNSDLNWKEGVSTRLDWANDGSWLVFDPCTVFEGISDSNYSIAADFARERTVKRYNRQLNSLLEFWANLLSVGEAEIKAFGTNDGIDATFQLSTHTAFSRRSMP